MTARCRGFVYAASLMGITGARDAVSGLAAGLVGTVRAHTRLPVAVGLGVRDGAQAAEVAKFADGVIVGSAFVQRLLAAPDLTAGVAAVRDLATELACAGVRSSGAAPVTVARHFPRELTLLNWPVAYLPSPARGEWHLGPLPVRGYALCIALGIIVAVWLTVRRYARAGGLGGTILDVAAWAVPFGLIGAAAGAVA